MKIIVVVDENWGIGRNNDLLFRLPADMEFFKKQTTNNVVVMGNNTKKSLPGGAALKNRVNVVLDSAGSVSDDFITAHSLSELSGILSRYPTDSIYIVGGGMMYRTMLPYCDTAYVTKVRADGGATIFFENLDNLFGWRLAEESEEQETNGHRVVFTKYENANPLDFFN